MTIEPAPQLNLRRRCGQSRRLRCLRQLGGPLDAEHGPDPLAAGEQARRRDDAARAVDRSASTSQRRSSSRLAGVEKTSLASGGAEVGEGIQPAASGDQA